MNADVIKRILDSKKTIMAMIPVLCTAIAEATGFNPLSWTLIGVDIAFAVLVGIQGVLDYKYGSPSDGTEKVAVKMAVKETTPVVTVVNKTEEKK